MREDWEQELIYEAEQVGEFKPAARTALEAAGMSPKSVNTVRYHMKRDLSFAARVHEALGVGRRRLTGIGALLLACALPAAAIESDPVNLGATGLSLSVSLLQWNEETGEWDEVDASAVTVVEEGDGSYSLDDLPAATGTDRYAATIALAAEPNRGLFTYPYGAQPGTRLVWQQEITLPSQPVVFKQDDTFGSISMVVVRNLPEEACEPETAVTFSAENAQTRVALFTDRAATISDCEEDVTTGSYGLTATYDLQAGDTETVAKYIGEFTICYDGGECHTLPANNILRFEVVRKVGG